MFALTLGSLRYRPGGFAASFIALFLGATILMTFASLLDTATAPGVDEDAAAIMTIMASVVGSWGLVIVTFAVTSTLTLLVRQRYQEMALLKSVGATPAQLGRLIVGEAAAVAVLAAAVAIAPAVFAGRFVLSLLKDTGQVPDGVLPVFGPVALGMGFGITVVAASVAAALATRRTARIRAREAMLAASLESPKMGRVRTVAGLVLLAGGVNCGVLTATVLAPDSETVMAVASEGAILSAIGLALLSPALLRAVLAAVAVPLRAITGVSGYLSVHNLRQRAQQMSGALMPIILFTGMATGTLYMQSIENATLGKYGPTELHETIETLNLVVVGMIALFTAIMVVNTLVAATTYRGREFGQQRLVGSTPPQVLRMVGVESAVLAVTGVLFGSIASVATIIPYSILKTGDVLPDTTIALYLGIVLLAVVLTLGASVATARHAIRVPAVRAAA